IMDQMQCIATFVQVVEQRGFARAARRLNISNAAVTRHVAALEDMLGSRLFDRTTRRLRLTEVGHACFERYARLLTELDEVRQLAQAGSVEPQGVLRVSSTVPFWMWRIAPVLPEFLHRYPKV